MADVNVNFPPVPSPARGVSLGEVETLVTQAKADVEGQIGGISARLAERSTVLKPTMTTVQIQNALDTYKNFLWLEGTYNVNPLFFRNNQRHDFQANVVIMANPGYAVKDRVLNIDRVSDITFYWNNTVVQMRKSDYIETVDGEYRHCMVVYSAKRIKNHGILICKDSGGDGVYVGHTPSDSTIPSEDISFDQVFVYNCKRQGMSVTSVKGLDVDYLYAEGITGTPPAYGIDIEPNNPNAYMDRIRIKTIQTKNCDGGGTLFAFALGSKQVDIKIGTIISDGDLYGVSFVKANIAISGNIEIGRIVSKNNPRNGLYAESWYKGESPVVKVNEVIIENVGLQASPSQRLNSAITLFNPIEKTAKAIGDIHLNNVDINNNHPNARSGIYSENKASALNTELNISNIKRIITEPTNKEIFVNGVINSSTRENKKAKSLTTTYAYQPEVDYYEKLNNTGAASLFTISLMMYLGNVVEIEVTNPVGLKVKPFAVGDVIYPDNVQSTGALQSAVVGSKLVIKKVTPTTYMILEKVGVWTVV